MPTLTNIHFLNREGVVLFVISFPVMVLFWSGSRLGIPGIRDPPQPNTSVCLSRLLPENAYGRWGNIILPVGSST